MPRNPALGQHRARSADDDQELRPAAWSLRTWVEIGGALGTIFLLGGTFAVAQMQIGELTGRMVVIESSTRADHDTMIEMRSDVKWIRGELERQRTSKPGAP